MLRNLILDWSGTLVDDLSSVFRATNHVLKTFHVNELCWEEFRERFCLPWQDFYRRWTPGLPLEDVERSYWEAMLSEQEKISLLPHARAFLEFAEHHRFPVFICSTVNPESFWGQATRLGVAHLIQQAYVGVHDKREVVHRILSENRLHPQETLFVGDMVHDMEAARHAGLCSCAVLTGFDPAPKLEASRPDYLVRDLRELQSMLHFQTGGVNSFPVATVGALIFNPEGRCLMVQTPKWSHKWGIPGGKIERGETAQEALIREIKEETGLPLERIEFALVQDCIEPEEFHRSAHFLLLNYFATSTAREVVLNHEAVKWQWIDPEQSLNLDLNRPTRILVECFLNHPFKTLLPSA